MQYQLKITADGSHTLYLPQIDEQYHSLNGAITESEYVYLGKGYLFNSSENPFVFEIGFGTGLNCLLTALKAEEQKRLTHYISLEKFPLENDIVKQLNYGSLISEQAEKLFFSIHNSEWGRYAKLSDYFYLWKERADITNESWHFINNSDIIYYDAFGPDKQKEMWTPEIYDRLYKIISPGGVLVTYSAKGEVRRGLTLSGFIMERLPGPPGKKEMLRGIKVSSNI